MPEQLPTEQGLYAGQFGYFFRLRGQSWSYIRARENSYAFINIPEREVAKYMPLRKIEGSEQDG